MKRQKITPKEVDDAIKATRMWMNKRIAKKGDGTFASTHEMRGVIHEEVTELFAEMHSNNYAGIEHELMDLAVAVVFGLACLRSGKLDW